LHKAKKKIKRIARPPLGGNAKKTNGKIILCLSTKKASTLYHTATTPYSCFVSVLGDSEGAGCTGLADANIKQNLQRSRLIIDCHKIGKNAFCRRIINLYLCF